MSLGKLVAYLAAISLYIALAGLYFDIAYHHIFPFEAFWSNPHILMYSGLASAFFLNIFILFRSDIAESPGEPYLGIFGKRISMYWIIYLLSSISALMGGYIDSIWHGIYGSFESAYSFPHTLALTSSITASLSVIYILIRRYHINIYIGSLLLSGVAMAFIRTFIGPFSNSKEFFLELSSGEGLGSHFEGESAVLWIKYVEKGVYIENATLSLLVISFVYISIAYLTFGFTGNNRSVFIMSLLTGVLLLIFHTIVDISSYNPVYRTPILFSIIIIGMFALIISNDIKLYMILGLIPAIMFIVLYGLDMYGLVSSIIGGILGLLYGYIISYLFDRLDIKSLIYLICINMIVIPAVLGYYDIFIRFL